MNIKNLLNPLYYYEHRALIKPALKNATAHYTQLFPQWLRLHGIPLTRNDRRIAALKDKHRSCRCFIIGNGPSLKIEDLDRLKGEITFASNKIYLAFGKTDWRPTYYSILDVLVAENNRDVINKLKLCRVYDECVRPFLNDSGDILWIRQLGLPLLNGTHECQFSKNVLEGVYGGWTVIYLQMQLAFYMGIRDIYLIGVDFSFKVPKSSGRICQSGEILVHQGEMNHFHPDYRKLGETWTMPLLDSQRKAFLAAKIAVEAHGGSISNASRKTELDVFPRVDFDAVVPSTRRVKSLDS